MSVEDLLESLGLTGPYQVHVAPTLLRPDLRAHQVFVGFESLAGLKWLYTPETQIHIVESKNSPTASTLADHCNRSATVQQQLGHSSASQPPNTNAPTIVIPAQSTENPGGLYGLVWVVDRLLGPGGCPWDQEQTHATLKKYLIEEAYELVQAIDDEDDDKLREELGDVLLQPVQHAQMQARDGNWDIDAVAQTVTEKLVRRHPHVFVEIPPLLSGGEGGRGVRGVAIDALKAAPRSEPPITTDQVLKNWDAIKQQEREGGVLHGIPRSMPALLRALEVSKRAARNGFEWPNVEGVWEKLDEETQELRQANTKEEQEHELGDLLFTVVNLARWYKIDPEDALRRMLDRFTARFEKMEENANKPLQQLNPEEWDTLWEQAKQ